MDYIKLLCVRLKVENGLVFIFIDVCLLSQTRALNVSYARRKKKNLLLLLRKFDRTYLTQYFTSPFVFVLFGFNSRSVF